MPEVWRWDGQDFRVCPRGPGGRCEEAAASRAFPFPRLAESVRFLNDEPTVSETQRLRGFRAWVREQAARGWTPA